VNRHAGELRCSGERAGRRGGAGEKPGRNSHTTSREWSEVCHLGRIPSGRSLSKRRPIGAIPGPMDSYVSLLHGDAEKQHCSPVHPVSPAGNPVQTHTNAPSRPVWIPRSISPRILHKILQNYTRLNDMLRTYTYEKQSVELVHRSERYLVANREEKHTFQAGS
jgi:hypothetical protein